MRHLFLIALVSAGLSARLCAAEEDSAGADSSAGLPKKYADGYLVAAGTVSHDKNFAVIYPKMEPNEKSGADSRKDYLVQLKPFKILGAIETDSPHFEHKNHGGISADWAKDDSVVLVTLASKWGPGDVFLYEVAEGSLKRSTNLLAKVRELLAPDFADAKPAHYNDGVDFIFEGDGTDVCRLDGNRVRINALATTDPKHIGGVKAWDARVEAVWNVKRGGFESKMVSRLFAGVRKQED